jgi:prepilin-type N-terminal cleavage/methylation domain-containing protein
MKNTTEPRTRRSHGFTLLEVLAAVAILGIWFSVLANAAIMGQRKEGENERRIRASLIADRVLSDLELGFGAGEFPVETSEEFEEDEFTVSVEPQPFSEIELESLDEELELLLVEDFAGLMTDLHAFEVRVTWTEGTGEKQVTRLTYAWDSTNLYEQLGLFPGDDPAPEGDGEDEPL